jgi:hypothetical protein
VTRFRGAGPGLEALPATRRRLAFEEQRQPVAVFKARASGCASNSWRALAIP